MKIKRDIIKQRGLLINGIAFLILAIICASEKSYLFSGILFITSAVNILGFRIWKEKKILVNVTVNLFNVIVACLTAYDFYMKNSQHIWKIYLLISLAYFIITLVLFIKYLKGIRMVNETLIIDNLNNQDAETKDHEPSLRAHRRQNNTQH